MASPSLHLESTRSKTSAMELSASAPNGDWHHDVDRPPLGSLIGMLFRAVVDRQDIHALAAGGEAMKPSHLYILRSLYPDGLSVTELANRTEITKQAVSSLVDSLELSKLVVRVANPGDRRAKIVRLTTRGVDALRQSVLAYGEVEREWAALLGGQDAMQRVREAIFAYIETHGDWHRDEQPRLRPVW